MTWIIGRKEKDGVPAKIIEITARARDFRLTDNWIDKRDNSILATQQEKDACFTTDINGKKVSHALFDRGLNTLVPKNQGGVLSDYSFYQLSEEDKARESDGEEHVITWTDNEITGVDFSPEENKLWVKFTADKTEIDDDGVDSVQITLEIWEADQSGIKTNLTASSQIPILTPNGEKWSNASVIDGVKVKNFSTTKSGTWVFPSKAKRFKNVRVMNQIVLTVIETDILG